MNDSRLATRTAAEPPLLTLCRAEGTAPAYISIGYVRGAGYGVYSDAEIDKIFAALGCRRCSGPRHCRRVHLVELPQRYPHWLTWRGDFAELERALPKIEKLVRKVIARTARESARRVAASDRELLRRARA